LAEQLASKHHVFSAQRQLPEDPIDGVTYLAFDVTQGPIDVTQLPDVIHGFVYAPGSINLRPFKGLKQEAFVQDMQLNFFGMIPVIQAILPRLQAADKSSIVLFSTVAVGLGMPFHSSIAAAKGAVEGFARALAAELAPVVRVNVIAPSLTHTSLADKFLNTPEKIEKAAERHPLKSVGKAEDIAAMAAYLLEDQSQWISGQVFHIDGGMSRLQMMQG